MAGQRDLNDHWSREARRNGYRSRAAYKLIQIDEKRGILNRGMTVLDLGCAPGSWLQVISERVGPRGRAWGVDLQPVDGGLPDNVTALEGDATHLEDAGVPSDVVFDAVLSDMMPNTTGSRDTDHFRSVGVCELALSLCACWLRPGGSLVMKVLEGSQMPELLATTRRQFERVKPYKPDASRKESTEIFIIATGFAGALDSDAEPTDPPVKGPPPLPEGWGPTSS